VLVGLGNTILADDAAGILVVRALADELEACEIDLRESCRGGLDLMEMLAGYDEAHLVDALLSGKVPPGTLQRLDLASLPRGLTLASSHEVDLPTALALGRRLGYALPAEVTIWAIEVVDPFSVKEELSAPVQAGLAECVRRISAALKDPGASAAAPRPRPRSARR
jgi:hydrogenase maturation protease